MRRIRADRRVGVLLGGILLASFVALSASVALPAADPEFGGKAPKRTRLEAHGIEVYRSEGCWYCHTQYLRESVVDAKLGSPLGPDAYAGDSPAMLGQERIGPDLSQGGSFGDAKSLIAYLKDPGAEGYHTSMPSYAYLGAEDLEALAAYLLSLR